MAEVQELLVGHAPRPVVDADGVERLAQLRQVDLVVARDRAELVRDPLPEAAGRVHGQGGAPREEGGGVGGPVVLPVGRLLPVLPLWDGVVVDPADEELRAVDVERLVADLHAGRGLPGLLGDVHHGHNAAQEAEAEEGGHLRAEAEPDLPHGAVAHAGLLHGDDVEGVDHALADGRAAGGQDAGAGAVRGLLDEARRR